MSKEIEAARELYALEAIRARYAEAFAADPDFILEVADGETRLMEAIDAMLAHHLDDETMVEALEITERKIRERKERLKGRLEWRRGGFKSILTALRLNKPSIQRALGTIALTRVAPHVEIFDDDKIPEALLVPSVRPDKKAIKEQLEAGKEVPGARMTEAGVTVRISR